MQTDLPVLGVFGPFGGFKDIMLLGAALFTAAEALDAAAQRDPW